MKMTNKILIAAATIIPTAIFAVLIYFWSYADVTPAGIIATTYHSEVEVGTFNKIEVQRGNWNIHVKQSDTLKLIVYGGDQLIESFMIAEVENNTLNLDIRDEFKYFDNASIQAELELPFLSEIELRQQSQLDIKHYFSDHLRVELHDNSAILMDSSRAANLHLKADGITCAQALDCGIDLFNYNLSGNSMIILEENPHKIKGHLSDNSYLRIGADEYYSESQEINYRIISSLMPDLSFVRNDQYLNYIMRENYNATLYDHKTGFKSEDVVSHRNRIFWYDIIRFTGGEILNEQIGAWNLTYNENKLMSCSIVFPSEDPEIFPRLLKKISNKLGFEPEQSLPYSFIGQRRDKDTVKIYTWQKHIDTLKSTIVTALSESYGTPNIRVFLLPDVDSMYESFANVRWMNKIVRKERLIDGLIKQFIENKDEDLSNLLRIKVH